MEQDVNQTSSEVTEGAISIGESLSQSIDSIKAGNLSEGLMKLASELFGPAAVGLLALIATYFVAKLISRWLAAIICRRVDETLGRFTGSFAFYSIMVVAATIILQKLDVQVSGLMAVLATAGFAIGLAFQGTLSNFASGVLLMVFRPFKVGDTVNVAGIVGTVNEIDLFTTKIDTSDNRRLILPNTSIAGNTIENITFHAHRRIDVTVGVAQDASLDQTRAALNVAAQSISEWIVQGEGRGFQISVNELTDTAVRWTVQAWVAKERVSAAKEKLITEIKRQFDLHQIASPLPHLRLYRSQEAIANQPHSEPQPAETNHCEKNKGSFNPPPSLSIPNIHPLEDRSSRVRPRVRGEK